MNRQFLQRRLNRGNCYDECGDKASGCSDRTKQCDRRSESNRHERQNEQLNQAQQVKKAVNMDYEQLVQKITSMSREDVTSEILRFNGHFHLDFTEEFLRQISEDRLRHILLAARLQQNSVH